MGDAMDPSAATNHSTRDADELASFLVDSMRLGEPTLGREHQQEQYHVEMLQQQLQHRHLALAPAPPREQQLGQHDAPMFAAPPAAHQFRMSPMMQGLQTTRQFWLPSQPYYSYSAYASPIGSPSRAGYASPISSSSRASHASRIGAADSSALGGYVPTQGGIQYRSVASSSSTASQYQHHYADDDDNDEPDYGSSFRERVRAIQAAQAQAAPLRERACRTLEETRSALLSGAPMELQLVTFPDSAAHVVHLLLPHEDEDAEDYEQILESVLLGVTRRVHDFIDNKEGHEVVVALLRACAGRHAEVAAIVHAAVARRPNGKHRLLRQTKDDYW